MLYVNPGYIELLDGDTSGATVNNSNNLYFYNTKNAYNLNISGCKELYIKLNVVKGDADTRIYMYNVNVGAIGVRLNKDGTYNDWNFQDKDSPQNLTPKIGTLINGHEYEIMIHAKSGTNDGLKEIYFNEILDRSFTGNINNGDAFPGITIQADESSVLFNNVIIADFDITDYHLAPVDIKDYETDFAKQSDGTIKATAMGQYISMHLDTDDLKAKMQKVVENAEIVGVNVGAFNVGYDSSIVNALKSSVNGTDAETIKLVNANAAGKILLVNPADSKDWSLSGLKSDTFKLTAEKV